MSNDAGVRDPQLAPRTRPDVDDTRPRGEASELKAGRVLARHIPSLDGLRAVSVIFVLIGHNAGTVDFNGINVGVILGSFGSIGVKIFFVISGYLITLLLLSEFEKTRKVDIFHFYVRRAFRILPAAYAFMIICFVLLGNSLSPVNKFLAVIFAENYSLHPQLDLGHLWSLGVEEQFYLLWPACFVFLPERRITVLLVALCAVPFINLAIIYYHLPYWGVAFYSVADALACGCLLALIRKHIIFDKVLESRWFFLIPVLTLAAGLVAGITGGGVIFGLSKSLVLRPGLNVGIALSIEKAVRSAPVILNLSVITAIGAMSYSIYLWQQLLSKRYLIPSFPVLDLLVRLAIIGLCACGSYFLVEQPFLRLRRKLFSA